MIRDSTTMAAPTATSERNPGRREVMEMIIEDPETPIPELPGNPPLWTYPDAAHIGSAD